MINVILFQEDPISILKVKLSYFKIMAKHRYQALYWTAYMMTMQFNTNVLVKEQQRHHPNASFQRRFPNSDWKGTFFPVDTEENYYNFMDNDRTQNPKTFQMELFSAILIACRCKHEDIWTVDDVASFEKIVFKLALR